MLFDVISNEGIIFGYASVTPFTCTHVQFLSGIKVIADGEASNAD